jgi:PIN domain nuclease of toxin-antitoxin system
MARYLLDTNVFISILTNDDDSLERDVQYILNDVENEFLLSMESVKELLVAFRRKRLLSKIFPSAVKMIEAIQRDYDIRILQVDMEVMRTLAKLTINEAQEHNDPSDHIIIAHAITLRLPLISSDRKFAFYTAQGLDLIYNKK